MAFGWLAFITAGQAHADQSWWILQTSSDKTVVASVIVEIPVASRAKTIALLNVGFGPERGCSAEIGFALLTGNDYGNPISRHPPSETKPFLLTIDGKVIPTQAPWLVQYSNGFEALAPGDQATLNALALGTTALVQLIPDSPIFKFPISGGKAAFKAAQRTCIPEK